MLHHDRELFEDLILRASLDRGIDAAIIEKDYYVSLLLREIQKNEPDVIFKGGTSLSKCYHLIDRFSEDIDISTFETIKPTEGQRRRFRDNIVKAVESLNLLLDNSDEIRSRREFNRYVISYPTVFDSASVNQKLIVETSVFIGIYPTEKKQAGNYLYEYLESNQLLDLLNNEELKPFSIKAQRPERTFIDKVFALGDYYLSGLIQEYSRHINDLFKLMSEVSLSDDLKKLIGEVRAERKGHKTCLSAQDNVDVNNLLNEISETDAFKEDYENITYYLLFNKVPYEEAKTVLRMIAEKGVF